MRPAQSYVVMALITVSAGIVCALIQCKVPSILPALSAQFGLNDTTGSLTMSVFTLMGIFFSIPASQVIQRLGAKKVMVWSTALMVAGSVLGTFAPNGTVLIVSRGIEGIALVAITIAGAAFIRDSAPPERVGTAIGIWSIWFASGSFIAGVVSPLIYNSLGFEALWLIYAALSVVAALAINFVVKAPNVVFAQTFESSAAPRYKELLAKNVVLFMLVFAVYNLMVSAVVSYLPTVLQIQGYEASLSGLISTIPMLISILSAPLLGIASDRLKRVKPLMSGAMLVLVLCAPLMFVVTGWQLWAVAIFCGVFGTSGAGLVMTALLATLPRVEVVPIALGIFSTMQALGMFLGSFLVPMLLGPDLMNWNFTALVLLIIGLAGFVCSILCKYR